MEPRTKPFFAHSDNRNLDQLVTHYWGVKAKDNMLSGWGMAKGGISVVIWAFRTVKEADAFLTFIAGKDNAFSWFRVVDLRKYRPRAKHISVIVGEDYPPWQEHIANETK